MPRRKRGLSKKRSDGLLNQQEAIPDIVTYKSMETRGHEISRKVETRKVETQKPPMTPEEIHKQGQLSWMRRPDVGDQVLYVEFGILPNGNPYHNEFLGVVISTHSEPENPEIVHFWAEFPDYRNHHDERFPNPKPVVEEFHGRVCLYFDNSYLTPKHLVSTCYLNKFCTHLRPPNYMYLHDRIKNTYLVARARDVVPTNLCPYGDTCTNDTTGHLINCYHECPFHPGVLMFGELMHWGQMPWENPYPF